jgi:hypothetical protein
MRPLRNIIKQQSKLAKPNPIQKLIPPGERSTVSNVGIEAIPVWRASLFIGLLPRE